MCQYPDEKKEEHRSENPEEVDWLRRAEVFRYEWIGRDVSDFLTEKEVPENENNRYQEEDERRGKGHGLFFLRNHLREEDIGIFCFFESQEFFAILCPFQLIKENEELSVVDVLPDFLYGMRRHSSWIMEMSEVFFEILESPRSKVGICLRNESIVSLSRS